MPEEADFVPFPMAQFVMRGIDRDPNEKPLPPIDKCPIRRELGGSLLSYCGTIVLYKIFTFCACRATNSKQFTQCMNKPGDCSRYMIADEETKDLLFGSGPAQ
jgi:hypothetical protein